MIKFRVLKTSANFVDGFSQFSSFPRKMRIVLVKMLEMFYTEPHC